MSLISFYTLENQGFLILLWVIERDQCDKIGDSFSHQGLISIPPENVRKPKVQKWDIGLKRVDILLSVTALNQFQNIARKESKIHPGTGRLWFALNF